MHGEEELALEISDLGGAVRRLLQKRRICSSEVLGSCSQD
jgi:hypothetical protein